MVDSSTRSPFTTTAERFVGKDIITLSESIRAKTSHRDFRWEYYIWNIILDSAF